MYLKAVHIIFIVTWFAGIFYMPRLFIYNTEAADKPAEVKAALREQFTIMMKRLWFGITWPSAILTLIFGPWVMFSEGWNKLLFQPAGRWLLVKLCFVVLDVLRCCENMHPIVKCHDVNCEYGSHSHF